MLYQVKYPNLWFMYSWHFMTIFQYYGLNIFFLSNWSANLAIFQCHREEDGGNVAKLFGAELDAEPGVRNGGYPMRQQWGFRGGKELKSMIYLIFRWSWVFIFDHGYLSLASPSIPWSWNIERTSSIFMRYLFIATLEKIRGWWQKSDVTMNCDNSFLEF